LAEQKVAFLRPEQNCCPIKGRGRSGKSQVSGGKVGCVTKSVCKREGEKVGGGTGGVSAIKCVYKGLKAKGTVK